MKNLLAFLVIALAIFAGPTRVAQTQDTERASVADEILIQFRHEATAAHRADARSWVDGARRRLLRHVGTSELELATTHGRSVADAVARLRLHPAVRYAEPNWIYTHQATSDDALYTGGSLWGMLGATTAPANEFGSQAGEAWRAENVGSATMYVGVIDEGIDLDHPDLAANLWTNPFDPLDGIDNDANGYIDDVRGWDFSQSNNSVYDGSPTDSATDSHGTHVSGTIGAVGGNGIGVAGVNWQVTMIPAKFLGPGGGTTADAVMAIDYITDLKTRHGLNIVATNNSWGGGGYSQALHDAIIRAADAGILFVAAAGNGNLFGLGVNNDTTRHYPSAYDTAIGTLTQPAASYDSVIAVASITSTGAISTSSNYGTTTVDLGAPGSSIWSTTPNNGYRSFSGTSMATPHVTGAVALYASLHPLAAPSDIKSAVLGSAVTTPTASLNNLTVTNGRLNIGYFAGPPPPPLPSRPPSELSAAAASSSQIDLTWADNSSDENGFEIEGCAGAGCTNFTVIGPVGANIFTYSATGLSANTLYRYRVRAFNGSGASDYSNEAEATQPDLEPAAAR
jgi:subtilisin family serine protease